MYRKDSDDQANDQRGLIEDAFLLGQKKKNATTSQILSVLSIIIAIPYLFILYSFRAQLTDQFFLCMSTLSVSSLLLSLVMFVWTIYQQKLLVRQQQLIALSKFHPASNFVLQLCTIMILLYAVACIYLFQEMTLAPDKAGAAAGVPEDQFAAFSINQRKLQYFTLAFLAAHLLATGIYGFTIFQMNQTQFDIKFSIVYNAATLFALLVLMLYVVRQCVGNLSVPRAGLHFSQQGLLVMQYLAYFALFLVSVILFLNLRNSKLAYLFLGSITLILLVILQGINYQVVQAAKSYRQGLIDNCSSGPLQSCPQGRLLDFACAKYLTKEISGKSIYDISSCAPEQLAYVWEIDEGQPVKQNKDACLNMGCCAVMADLYSQWYFRLNYLIFALVCAGIALAVNCFLQNSKINHNQVPPTGFVCMQLFLLLVVLAGMAYGVYFTSTLPLAPGIAARQNLSHAYGSAGTQTASLRHQARLPGAQSHLPQSHALQSHLPQSHALDAGAESCNLLGKTLLRHPFAISPGCKSACSESQGLRACVWSRNLTFQAERKNQAQLRVFDSMELISNLFGEDARSAGICVEGKAEDVNEFLNFQLRACNLNPLTTPDITAETYEVMLPWIAPAAASNSQDYDQPAAKRKQSAIAHESRPTTRSPGNHMLGAGSDLQKCVAKLNDALERSQLQCHSHGGDPAKQRGNYRRPLDVSSVSSTSV